LKTNISIGVFVMVLSFSNLRTRHERLPSKTRYRAGNWLVKGVAAAACAGRARMRTQADTLGS